jgi:hypothetical protein
MRSADKAHLTEGFALMARVTPNGGGAREELSPMDEITSILGTRLPQPAEWEELPAHLAGVLRALSRRWSTVPQTSSSFLVLRQF